MRCPEIGGLKRRPKCRGNPCGCPLSGRGKPSPYNENILPKKAL